MPKIIKFRLFLVLSFLVAIVAGRMLPTSRHFHTHDDIQVFRLNEFISCLKDFQIPCRWSKNLGKGFGYPLFIFYPPVIYIIPSLFHFLGFSLVTSLNLFAFFTILLAAYSMYQLVFHLTKKPTLAFLASSLYTLLPYHAVNLFVRGVYAETFALSLFPLILEGFYRLAKGEIKNFKPALVLTLLFLTHNISTMLMYPLTLLWTIILYFKYKNSHNSSQQTLRLTITNLFLPLGLSAFFFLPMLFEKSLVQTESMVFGYYSFINHFVSLKQLFLSTLWGYGGSTFGVKDDGMSFMLGKLYWIPFFLAFSSYFLLLIKKRQKPDLILAYFSLLTPIFIFLTHVRSTPIWLLLAPLKYLQFPWRFIGLATMYMVVSLALLLNKLIRSPKVINLVVVVWVIFLLFAYLPLFRPEKFDSLKDQDFLFGAQMRQQQQEHVYDYLPKTVHSLPDEFTTSPLFVWEKEKPTVQVLRWNSKTLSLKLINPQKQTITFSIFYYPGWRAFLDYQLTPISPHPSSGLITLNLPEGEHIVSFHFQATPLRLFADTISLASLLVLLKIWTF